MSAQFGDGLCDHQCGWSKKLSDLVLRALRSDSNKNRARNTFHEGFHAYAELFASSHWVAVDMIC